MEVQIGNYPRTCGGEREVKIKVDEWDIWSVDETLKLIIHPLLILFKKELSSYCEVEEGDALSGLGGLEAWLYVLDRMVEAFDPYGEPCMEDYNFTFPDLVGNGVLSLAPDNPQEYTRYKEDVSVYEEKCKEGLRLFAKYFTGLWS